MRHEDLLWETWKIDKGRFLMNEMIAQAATDIAQRRADLYAECVDRTWLLRFVPKDMLFKVRGQ